MSTSHESAMSEYDKYRIKRKQELQDKKKRGFYADGKPVIEGKTKSQIKNEVKEAWANRDKGKGDVYKTHPTSQSEKKTTGWKAKEGYNIAKRYGWAGLVGLAYRRNQKAPGSHKAAEKGYREDYR